MTRAFLAPLSEANAVRDAVTAAIPVLNTDRLTLRAPRLSDFEVLEPIWRTDRGVFIGGPMNEEDAWLDYAQTVAGWVLRGIGYWVVTLKDGTVLGLVGIGAETADPELEMGWLFVEAAEGHGYATEAAQAVRAYAFETLGIKTLVSFVYKNNARSVALAKRLGATIDTSVQSDALTEDDHAFRHINEATQ